LIAIWYLSTNVLQIRAHHIGHAAVPQRVVLIDGIELANLMIDFNVGVSPVTTYTVKKLDMDCFEDR
jgi:restriction endonuclease Mrr